MKNKILKKLQQLLSCTVASILLASLVVIPGARADLTNLSLVIGNTNLGEATGTSTFTFTSDVVANAGDFQMNLVVYGFAGNDIDGTGDNHLWDHCSATVDGSAATIVEDDGDTYLESYDDNVDMYITLNTAVAATDEVVVSCDSTVIDTNPSAYGSYEVDFAVEDLNDSDFSAGTIFYSFPPPAGQIAVLSDGSGVYVANETNPYQGYVLTNSTTVPANGEIVITYPAEFTMDDIVDASGSIMMAVDDFNNMQTITTADLTSNVLSITVPNEITAGSAILLSFAPGLVDNAPATAGDYSVQFETQNASATTLDTGSYDVTVVDADLSRGGPSDRIYNFYFAHTTTIPSGGSVMITFPEEYTMDDIADASSVVELSAGWSSVSISSANVTDKVLTIVVGEEVATGSTLHVATLTDAVVDGLPSTSGQYGIQIMSKDDEGETLNTWLAYDDVNNSVTITATVQEALIMTLDDTSVNLNVDPSVNNGEDYSQKTLLNVKTNAANGYKIQAQLQDSDTNATLKNGTHNINTGSVYDGASYTPNTFSYVAYNDDETKDKAGLKSDIESANGTGTFQASSSDLSLYNGTASGVGFASNTNSQDHTIYYILYVDYQTVAGIYSANVIYTALPTF